MKLATDFDIHHFITGQEKGLGMMQMG